MRCKDEQWCQTNIFFNYPNKVTESIRPTVINYLNKIIELIKSVTIEPL